jgi:hypothetical protein
MRGLVGLVILLSAGVPLAAPAPAPGLLVVPDCVGKTLTELMDMTVFGGSSHLDLHALIVSETHNISAIIPGATAAGLTTKPVSAQSPHTGTELKPGENVVVTIYDDAFSGKEAPSYLFLTLAGVGLLIVAVAVLTLRRKNANNS